MAAAGERAPWWSVLGWAAYLACSWTWCIGMFLPVLLVRDYGIWGFVVFAVPNVVGAGGMGWVLTRESSARLVERHRKAILYFSIVTVAFQIFFAFWLLLMTGNHPLTPVFIVIFFVALPTCVVATMGTPRQTMASVAIWLLSVAAIGTFAARGGISAKHIASSLGAEKLGLWLLAPVCVFGFALCPYLDITFHRVLRHTSRTGGRVAFTLGFGFFFLTMILFTLCYAWVFRATTRDQQWERLEEVVYLHIIGQIAFTIMAHGLAYVNERTRAVVAAQGARLSRRGMTESLGIGLIFFAVPILVTFAIGDRLHSGMLVGEIVYRCFMSFYGLVFPAYVWLCMIPTRDGHSGTGGERGRRKLLVCAAACVLAAPCYWMGFIERVEWWLGVGLGVVLLSRLFVRGKSTSAADTST